MSWEATGAIAGAIGVIGAITAVVGCFQAQVRVGRLVLASHLLGGLRCSGSL
jgi:hypothetical protein